MKKAVLEIAGEVVLHTDSTRIVDHWQDHRKRVARCFELLATDEREEEWPPWMDCQDVLSTEVKMLSEMQHYLHRGVTSIRNTSLEGYCGFEEDELRQTFELVSDRKDWKAPVAYQMRNPIDLDVEKIESFCAFVIKVVCAIRYYTATDVKVKIFPDGKVLFTADGYRDGPCGP